MKRRSREMPPGSAVSYVPNSGSRYVIASRENGVLLGRSPDRQHIGFGQFRTHVRFTPDTPQPTFLDHVPCVVRGGSKKQMLGVYTQRHIAAVENTQPIRDRAIGSPVCFAMRHYGFAGARNSKKTIPSGVYRSLPQPAPRVGFRNVAVVKVVPSSFAIPLVRNSRKAQHRRDFWPRPSLSFQHPVDVAVGNAVCLCPPLGSAGRFACGSQRFYRTRLLDTPRFPRLDRTDQVLVHCSLALKYPLMRTASILHEATEKRTNKIDRSSN